MYITCKVIISIFVITFGFFIYQLYKNKSIFPYANIELMNKSEINIKEIIIEHNNGKITHTGLGIDSKIKYPIYIKGEGAYSIYIVFSDSNIAPLNFIGYLEASYNLKEIIKKDKIIEYNSIF